MDDLTFKQITKKELKSCQSLILPMVYEELCEQPELETRYIAISAWDGKNPVGAVVTNLEEEGDLSLLSIWVDQDNRRKGIASALIKKMIYVAYRLYRWEENQYGDDISLKVMYCLADQYREPFERWLQKNDFTDFCVMRESSLGQPEICTATAEIHFYRFGEEDLN